MPPKLSENPQDFNAHTLREYDIFWMQNLNAFVVCECNLDSGHYVGCPIFTLKGIDLDRC